MGSRVRLIAASSAAVLAVALSGCTGVGQPAVAGESIPREKPRQHPTSEAVEPEVRLTTGNHRKSKGVVAAGGADAPYNYGPTVMVEGDRTRMWWCSQYGAAKPPGDDILHGTAAAIGGRFTSTNGRMPRAVFSGSRGGFDGKHTCDPSVIKVDGVYYLYYTGAKGDHAFGNAIGLATSSDGLTWHRSNGGKPIVKPSHGKKRQNAYGVGQPAAVYLDGWFYLMFTDTTAMAAGWNGAGQFLLRSPNPGFEADVEALGPHGFTTVTHTAGSRDSSLVDAFSADLMWVDVLDVFAIAHQTDRGTTVTFWDRHFTVNPYPPVSIPGPWREGPGLVRTATGHAPTSPGDPCGTVPLDVVRATENLRAPTNLRHFGMDLLGANGCAERDEAIRLLDGYAFPSPERTMDFVSGGEVVRVDRRSVAEALAIKVLNHRPPAMAELPVAARLEPGAPVLHSPSHGTGVLLDDGKLWRLSGSTVAEALARLNGSPARTISDANWSRYPAGPTLG